MARGPVYSDPAQRKDAGIRVRMTQAERALLEEDARTEGVNLSDLARQRLGLAALSDEAAQAAPELTTR